jgi:hypothetical protein
MLDRCAANAAQNMSEAFKKTKWLFFLLILGLTNTLIEAQSTPKPPTKKRSVKRKTKIITGTSVPGSITKEWAVSNPKLLTDIQEKLLKGVGNDHDMPMALAEVGDISSVPALIAVLKRNPAFADGTMICTRAHCLLALTKLTGVNVGKTDEAWEKWWEEYKKTH